MAAITVSGPPVDRAEEILTDDALAFVADLQQRFGERRDELLGARQDRRARIAETGRLDFLYETAHVRTSDWRVAETPAGPSRPTRRDHRPDRAEDDDQRSQLGREGMAGRPRGRQHPALGECRGRPGQPRGRRTTHDHAHLGRGQGVPAHRPRPDPGDRAAAARLALRRGAPDHRRRTGRRRPGRLRALLLPQRPRAARARQRPLLLPAEAGEPPRGTALERRVHPRAAGARACRTGRSGPPC